MMVYALLFGPASDGIFGNIEEFLASFLIVALGLNSWDFSRTLMSARLQQPLPRRTPDGPRTRTEEERRVDDAETNREDPER